MKNLVKKLVLSVLVATTVITTVPVSNVKAATKTYTITKCPGYKNTYYVNINIDKTSPSKCLSLVNQYGKKENSSKKIYVPRLTCKAKNEDNGVIKCRAYGKKIKKVDKYGMTKNITFNDSNEDYNYSKGIFTVELLDSCGSRVYADKFIEHALNSKEISTTTYYKDGTSRTYTARVKDLFPNRAAFKKASDSVKAQFLCTYAGNNCMTYGTTAKHNQNWNWESMAKENAYGVCQDFTVMYANILILIDTYYNIGDTANNHDMGLFAVKNSNGKLDYFETNNTNVRNFAYTADKTNKKSLNLLDLMYAKKLYKKDSDWNKATKYANSWKVSEFNKLVEKKSKNYDASNDNNDTNKKPSSNNNFVACDLKVSCDLSTANRALYTVNYTTGYKCNIYLIPTYDTNNYANIQDLKNAYKARNTQVTSTNGVLVNMHLDSLNSDYYIYYEIVDSEGNLVKYFKTNNSVQNQTAGKVDITEYK